MTAATDNYAEVLCELGISEESIQDTRKIFKESPEFCAVLSNPTIAWKTKCRVIDRVIPEEMRSFVKVVVRHHKSEMIDSIFEDYENLCKKQKGVIRAVLRYVVPPNDTQLEGFRSFLCREFKAQSAEITLQEDPGLLGGFILKAGDVEYDRSFQGRFRKLEQQLTTRR